MRNDILDHEEEDQVDEQVFYKKKKYFKTAALLLVGSLCLITFMARMGAEELLRRVAQRILGCERWLLRRALPLSKG